MALHEMAALYGDLIDARDWEGLERVFTADVVWGNPQLPGQDLRGLEMVRRFMSRARHPLAHRVVRTADGWRVRARQFVPRTAPPAPS